MTAVATHADNIEDTSDDTPKRQLTPRRVWPGSRATIGGLLVALAALGLYATVRSAQAPPSTLYVVARTAIAPGTVLTPDLVGAQRMDLPDGLAAGAFSSIQDDLVIGSVAIEAIAAGELVQQSDIRPDTGNNATPFEMSFRVDSDRAVGGTLRAGERVDVIATFGSSAQASTQVIERNILVIAVRRSGDSSLAGERQVITVALDNPEQAVSLAGAVDKANITLVRTLDSGQ